MSNLFSVLGETMQCNDLDEIIEAYEQACQTGAPPALAEFVPDAEHPRYAEIVVELIRVDLEYSHQSGHARPLDEYRREFADVLQCPERWAAVAFEDYRLRRLAGENVSHDRYRARYDVATDSWPELPCGEVAVADAPSDRDALRWFRHLTHRDPEMARRVAAALDQLPGLGERFLDFELVGELGRGALGRVYLARQRDLARRFVALKVTAELTDEPQHLAQLQHTNVIPIYSVHRHGALQAVCMPFLGPTTLADVLRAVRRRDTLPARGQDLISTVAARRASTLPAPAAAPSTTHDPEPPPADQNVQLEPDAAAPGSALLDQLRNMSYVDAAVALMTRVADGLAHAHDHGLVHSDLKPANILISDEGEPVILDFHLSSSGTSAPSTVSVVGGTLPYMAPEHIRVVKSGGRVDPRSDLFSLGVILFELVTGHHPYPLRDGPFEQVADRASEDRAVVPSARKFNRAISPGLNDIIAKCLAPRLADRYSSATQLREDLQSHLEHRPLRHVVNRSVAERGRKWLRRHPKLTSATTIMLMATVIVLALGAIAWQRGEQLARRAARDALERLAADVASAQGTLNLPGADQTALDRAVKTLEHARTRYLGTAATPPVILPDQRRLDSAQRTAQCRVVAQLWYLLAAGHGQLAVRAAGARQHELFQRALRDNQCAQRVSNPAQIPRAVWLQRARLYDAMDDPDAARRARQEAARQPVDDEHDRYWLAYQWAQQGDYPRAAKQLDALLRRRPHDALAWLSLGNCRLAMGQWHQADVCFSVATALPGAPNLLSCFGRGVAHLEQNEFAEAQRDFNQALEIAPDLPEALLNRALARRGLGDFKDALRDVDQALALGTSQTRAYFMRAALKQQLGDPAGAQRDRQTGLEKRPTDELSWIERGVQQLSVDPRAALADFRSALRLNPSARGALQNIAHVLAERLDDPQGAIAALDQLARLNPDDPEVVAGRGVLHARLGHRDRALRDARHALQRAERPLQIYQIACIWALTSKQHAADAERAFELLARALRQDATLVRFAPSDPDLAPLRSDPRFNRLVHAAQQLCLTPTR